MDTLLEEVLKELEKLGLTEQEAEELYAADDEGIERFSQFLETRNFDDIDQLVNIMVNLDNVDSRLCLPIYELLYYRYNYFLDNHLGDVYFRYGEAKQARQWYERGMAASRDNCEYYIKNAIGFLKCAKTFMDYQNVPEVILNLLPYCNNDPESAELWEALADVYKGEYGIEPRPDIVLGCLMQARHCCNKKSESPEIRFMRKTNPQLYERAVRLDVREAIRRNLTDGEQEQPEQEAQEQQQPSSLTLRVGDMEDIDKICSKLAAMGYCKSEYAFMQGQYARRGGIVDVFPYGSRLPYRIDLFDDGIDSIRTFDSRSMLSIDRCNSCVIAP